jgi:hypothetical protein
LVGVSLVVENRNQYLVHDGSPYRRFERRKPGDVSLQVRTNQLLFPLSSEILIWVSLPASHFPCSFLFPQQAKWIDLYQCVLRAISVRKTASPKRQRIALIALADAKDSR